MASSPLRWSPIDYTVSTQPRPPSSTHSHVTTHTPHHHTATTSTGTAAAAGKKGKKESSDGGSSKSAKNSYQFPKLSGIDGGGRGGDDEGSEGNRETTSVKDEADDVEKDSVSKGKQTSINVSSTILRVAHKLLVILTCYVHVL